MEEALLVKLRAINEASDKIKQVVGDIDEAGKKSEDARKGFTALGVAITASSAALMLIGKKSIDAYAGAEMASAKFNILLRNQGVSYAKVKDEIENYASAMQKNTIFEDDYVKGTLADMIAKQMTLKQAMSLTTSAAQLAIATDTDLKSASMQLVFAAQGRATMLVRTGALTKEQAREIDKLGTTEERVAKISVLLNKTYAGLVEDVNKTYINSMKRFENTFGDLFEKIGEVFLPTLTTLINKLIVFIDWLNALNPVLFKVVAIAGAVATALTAVAGASLLFIGNMPMLLSGLVSMQGALSVMGKFIIGTMIPALKGLAISMAANLGPVLLITAAIAGLTWIMVELIKTRKVMEESQRVEDELNNRISKSISGVGLQMKKYNDLSVENVKNSKISKKEIQEYTSNLSVMKTELMRTGQSYEHINKAMEHARLLYKVAKEDLKELTDEQKQKLKEQLEARKTFNEKIKASLQSDIQNKLDALEKEIQAMEKAKIDKKKILEYEIAQRNIIGKMIKDQAKERAKIEQETIESFEDRSKDQYDLERKSLAKQYKEYAKYIKDKNKLDAQYEKDLARINKREIEDKEKQLEELAAKEREKNKVSIEVQNNLLALSGDYLASKMQFAAKEESEGKRYSKSMAISVVDTIKEQALAKVAMTSISAMFTNPAAFFGAIAQSALIIGAATTAKAAISGLQTGGLIEGTKEGNIVRIGENYTKEWVIPDDKLRGMLAGENESSKSKPLTINFNGIVGRPRETAREIQKMLQRYGILEKVIQPR